MNIEFMGGPFDGEVREFAFPPIPESVIQREWRGDYALYCVGFNGRAWYMPPEGVTT